MKRMTAFILTAALALAAAGAFAEAAESLFETLTGLEWSFSSGAGAWSTDLRILEDGSFSGEFHDGEMGEMDDAYPYGTVYRCDFSGKLSVVEQTAENVWKLRVDELRTSDQPEEEIDGGVRYVRAEPYGLSEGDEMLLYAPGTKLAALSEDMRLWTHAQDMEDAPDALSDWFLCSEKNDSGFISWNPEPAASLPNPWREMTAEQLQEASGIAFGVPDGAENVVYRYLESEKLAEMQFTREGGDYCARIQPFEDGEVGMPDISGMYFAWDDEEEVTIRGCRGLIGRAQCGSEDWVQRCIWYDTEAGMAGSLSVSTTDLDGLDLTALAEQVYTK